jgi:hypothetical protein
MDKNKMVDLITDYIIRMDRGSVLFETGRKYIHRVTDNAKIQAIHLRPSKSLPEVLCAQSVGDDVFEVGPSYDEKITVAHVAQILQLMTESGVAARLFIVANHTQFNPYIKRSVAGADETMCLYLVWNAKEYVHRPHMTPDYRLICEWKDHNPTAYDISKSKYGEYGRLPSIEAANYRLPPYLRKFP